MLQKATKQFVGAITLMAIAATAATAQNKVVVIPLGGGEAARSTSIRQSLSSMQTYANNPASINYYAGSNKIPDNGNAVLTLTGPRQVDGRYYRLTSLTYCITASTNRFLSEVTIWTDEGLDSISDSTVRNASGCYTIDSTLGYSDGYGAVFTIAGASSELSFNSIYAAWELQPSNFTPSLLSKSNRVADTASHEQTANGM